jgi:hypothetical protein
MKKRGKPSTADKTVAPVLRFTRKLPAPPPQLSPRAAETWRAVISSPSGDLLSPEAYPVLIEYARAVEQADQIAEQVSAFDPAWLRAEGGLERWSALLRIQDQVARRVASLAVKLKLTLTAGTGMIAPPSSPATARAA